MTAAVKFAYRYVSFSVTSETLHIEKRQNFMTSLWRHIKCCNNLTAYITITYISIHLKMYQVTSSYLIRLLRYHTNCKGGNLMSPAARGLMSPNPKSWRDLFSASPPPHFRTSEFASRFLYLDFYTLTTEKLHLKIVTNIRIFYIVGKGYLLRASQRSERASSYWKGKSWVWAAGRPAYRPWGRSSKANILGTGHPIDKRSSLLNITWT